MKYLIIFLVVFILTLVLQAVFVLRKKGLEKFKNSNEVMILKSFKVDINIKKFAYTVVIFKSIIFGISTLIMVFIINIFLAMALVFSFLACSYTLFYIIIINFYRRKKNVQS